MNILITLPKNLIEKIISGEKLLTNAKEYIHADKFRKPNKMVVSEVKAKLLEAFHA